jgi:hypothetical protein
VHAFQFTPAAADLPPGVDVDQVVAQVQQGHVAAPQDLIAPLRDVVVQAQARGVDLSVVVVPQDPPMEADLRDLAIVVAKHEHGTILVLSPNTAGTSSDQFSRVRLEAAEDPAKYTNGQTVHQTQVFVDRLTGFHASWTAVTLAAVLLGTLAAALLYRVKSRR